MLWGVLFLVLPAFDKMFTETGIELSRLTDPLVTISRHFVLGTLAGSAFVLGVAGLFWKRRERASTRYLLVALAWLSFLCLPVIGFAVFSNMIQLIQRL